MIACRLLIVILPDWQGRGLHRQAAEALTASRDYLAALLEQYARGRRDDLAYRLARRNAHNADAELAALLANARQEPGPFRRDAERGLPFQLPAHTLLNYLSALGAHRGEEGGVTPGERGAGEAILAELDALAEALRGRRPPADSAPPALGEGRDEGPGERFLGAQLALIAGQLTPLREAATRLVDDTP